MLWWGRSNSPSTPRYIMKVEQENFLPAILRSVQRRRRRSGTRRFIARAKSAFITMESAFSTPEAVRMPVARRPSNSTSSTGESVRISTPSRSATRAIATVTAAHPPMGWKTPYSYSRNERIENKLGQRNGDMPRYFDWNENARRMRGSRKKRPR